MTENNKKCLITQNIISSISWYITAPDSIIKPERGGDGILTWKEKALNDLKATLGRVKTPFSEAAMRGVVFEKAVYKEASKPEVTNGTPFFQKVCNEVKGFTFYQKGGKTLNVDGEVCYLYGKYDAIKRSPEVYIKDIKTTSSYKEGKYKNSFQSQAYCYIEKAVKMDYIIAEWDIYPNISEVYIEEYVPPAYEILEGEIRREISEAFQILKELGLWDLYRNVYCLY